jgi:hypothetical protein
LKWNIPSNIAFAYVLIAGAVLGAAVSVLGCLTVKCKHYCFTVPLMLIALITGLIFFAAGIGVLAFDVQGLVQKEICSSGGALKLNGKDFVQKQYS